MVPAIHDTHPTSARLLDSESVFHCRIVATGRPGDDLELERVVQVDDFRWNLELRHREPRVDVELDAPPARRRTGICGRGARRAGGYPGGTLQWHPVVVRCCGSGDAVMVKLSETDLSTLKC